MMIIIAMILICAGTVTTTTMEGEGLACMDMAIDIPQLQTITGE